MFLRACVLGAMHLPGRCVVVVWMLCVQRNAVPGKTPTSPPLPSTHPSSHPSEPAPVHPSLPHRASLPADIPLPVPYPFLSIFLPLHPSMSSSLPALFFPSLLLSLPFCLFMATLNGFRSIKGTQRSLLASHCCGRAKPRTQGSAALIIK